MKLADEGRQLKVPFFNLMKSYKIEVILCFMINCGGAVFYSVFALLLPTILSSKFKYSLAICYNFNLYYLIIFILFTIISAWGLSKLKINTKIVYLLSVIIIGIYVFPAFYIYSTKVLGLVTINYTVFAILGGSITGILPYIIAQFFPTEIRFSGISTSYNLAQAIGGGLTPLFVTFLIEKFTSIYIVPIFIAAASIIISAALIILIIRNKHGKSLYE